MDPENVEDLQRAVCMLSDENDMLYLEINHLKDQMIIKDSLLSRGLHNIDHYVKETLGGLSRLTISSNKYHKNNPNVTRTFFGLDDRGMGSI